MKKLIWIILLIAAGYFAYTILSVPPQVTIATYKQIHQGMTRPQFEMLLGGGKLRDESFDPTRRFDVAYLETDPRYCADLEGLLEELEKDANVIYKQATSGNAVTCSIRSEVASKEGTLKPDNTFVPAKQAKIYASTYRTGPGGIQNFDYSGDYEFHDYLEDVTVDNKQYKLIRNGEVHFDPKPAGKFVSWRGQDGRIITVLFLDGKTSYWSYQGPEKDFSGLPPLTEVKVPAPDATVQKGVMKENEAPKTPEPAKKIKKTKPEVAPQPPVKSEAALKIEEYQKKRDEAKKSLETVKEQCAKAKTEYEAASSYDMKNKKKAYAALKAKMEKISADIQNYNLLINELKVKGHN